MTERRALTLIAASSAIVLGFLFWLLYFREGSGEPPPWTASLPALNASLNLTSAVALSLGFIAIRRGRRALHMKLMLTAVLVGLCFLVSYIVYHHYQGDTPFPGEGVVRPVYFSILISHIVLSIVGLPLVLATLFFAASGRFDSHRRIARITFPVWLYVSITGVAVFVFLELW